MQPPAGDAPPQFRTVRFFAKGIEGRRIHLIEVSGDDQLRPPSAAEDGGLNVHFKMPVGHAHHTHLGIFMDRWSQLEHTLKNLLSTVTGVPLERCHILTNALGTRALIETIKGLSHAKLTPEDRQQLDKLLNRIANFNTKRNYLVHGHWVVLISALVNGDEAKVYVSPAREHTPTDPGEDQALSDYRNQSVRGKYLYTAKDIERVTRDVVLVEADLIRFMADRQSRDPDPANRDSTARWTLS